MQKNKSSKLIKMLLDEAEARNSFMADPVKFVTDKKLDISEEEIQSLLSVSHDALDDLSKGIDVKNDKVSIQASRSGDGDVEVLCACGAGYWAK
jgi:hypothetical protein